MRAIYKLTAFELEGKYFVEEAYFTSKKKAEESKKELIYYLNWNHRLNVDNVETFKNLDCVILDNKFNVTLVKHDVKTKVLKYV